MSSFITSAPQRRGNKAARIGNSYSSASSSNAGFPKNKRTHAELSKNLRSKQRTAIIGDSNSNGLVIQGSHEKDGHDPNSDAHDRENEFPVIYSGRGVLSFKSPVKISSIDSSTNVNGTLSVTEDVIVGNGITFDNGLNTMSEYSTGTWTPGFISPGGQNVATYATGGQTGTWTKIGNRVFVDARISWTAIANVTTDVVRLAMPFSSAAGPHAHRYGGSITYNTGFKFTGSELITGINVSEELNYAVINYSDHAGGTSARFLLGTDLETAGIIYFNIVYPI